MRHRDSNRINPDLDGYWTDDERKETMGYNVSSRNRWVRSRKSTALVKWRAWEMCGTQIGPLMFSQLRMLSIDDDASSVCGLRESWMNSCGYNSLASGADNGVHIVYGRTLHYVLPTFQPGGRSIYAALAGLAKSVNATLSFEKNVIMITDRRPFRAVTDGATGTGTADI